MEETKQKSFSKPCGEYAKTKLQAVIKTKEGHTKY